MKLFGSVKNNNEGNFQALWGHQFSEIWRVGKFKFGTKPNNTSYT